MQLTHLVCLLGHTRLLVLLARVALAVELGLARGMAGLQAALGAQGSVPLSSSSRRFALLEGFSQL